MKELLFQVVLHVLVFVFYAFDRQNPTIEISQIGLFLNYAVAAAIINYGLLPYLYYQKKHLQFVVFLLLVIAGVLLLEEFVLERIFFPGTRRAEIFQGVFFTLIDILPVMAILVGFKFGWDAFAKQRELDKLKNLMQESEMQFLKSQINPHFLFNNLNNIYAYTVEDTGKAQQIILELSSVLRYMLYECKEQYVPLAKEVEQLENFTRLNELQIEERGTVNFRREGIVGAYKIAPLILIVFIENAFKHSQSSQSENIEIDINLRMEPGPSAYDTLHFTCRNTYSSAGVNTQSLSQGIGLVNVRKRLELLYPNRHELQIHQSGGYYEVQLSLQLPQGLN